MRRSLRRFVEKHQVLGAQRDRGVGSLTPIAQAGDGNRSAAVTGCEIDDRAAGKELNALPLQPGLQGSNERIVLIENSPLHAGQRLDTGEFLHEPVQIALSWLGSIMFDLFFRANAENDKYARHVRSSSGVAVFVAERADADHWVRANAAGPVVKVDDASGRTDNRSSGMQIRLAGAIWSRRDDVGSRWP